MMLNTPLLKLRYKLWFMGVFQASLIVCSLVLAWLLRFDFTLPHRHILIAAIPVLVFVRLSAMAYFGLLHSCWKYVGLRDGVDVLKAVAAGSVLFWATMSLALGADFPPTLYVLEAVLTAELLLGARLFSRWFAESARESFPSCKRALLIGAGHAAQTILREMHQPGCGYMAVGCLDDDPAKLGMRIHNVRVLGPVDKLADVLASERVDEVLIAVPSASGAQMRRFVEICNRANTTFRTVPALRDIIAGEVIVNQLREVTLEDLLGRRPAQIDLEAVQRNIAGQTVLVTGAAGSIGSELCRQILGYSPSRLVCLDQSETGLFFLRLELQGSHPDTELAFCIADVNDTERVSSLLSEFRPQIIFHAAAYKHVPLMEVNVREAVNNNVLALLGLLNLADESGCRSFVLISSDKAVNPTNVMGATKRICELILSSRPPNGMRCVSVRFGNVLGSSGSVIPVLKQQLRNREPLTITHPEIKRYFMIPREAVALVLQAAEIGDHGDILVLDMGEPMRILDLARNLIRLSGKSEHEVEIQFTGLRDGEKLEEELFYSYEKVFPTSCDRIKRTNASVEDWSRLCRQLDELHASFNDVGAGAIRGKIQEIVPEYFFHSESPIELSTKPPAQNAFEAVAGND